MDAMAGAAAAPEDRMPWWKTRRSRQGGATTGGGAVYGLGMIGAMVYFFGSAESRLGLRSGHPQGQRLAGPAGLQAAQELLRLGAWHEARALSGLGEGAGTDRCWWHAGRTAGSATGRLLIPRGNPPRDSGRGADRRAVATSAMRGSPNVSSRLDGMPHEPTRTAASLLVECLAAEGCEYVFSVPGEETMDILDALGPPGHGAPRHDPS